MDNESLGALYTCIEELHSYFKYFDFTNVYGGTGLVYVDVSESMHNTDIETYDYDVIRKKIDVIANQMKDIIIKSQLKR